MGVSPGNCVVLEVMMGNQTGWGTGLRLALRPNTFVCLCGVRYFPTLPTPAAPPSHAQTSNRENLPTLLKKATPWNGNLPFPWYHTFHGLVPFPLSHLSTEAYQVRKQENRVPPKEASEHHRRRAEKGRKRANRTERAWGDKMGGEVFWN